MPDWVLPLIASPFIGSFAAVLIRRLPREQPIALARSRCEACGHVLGPWEMIPLISAAALSMRCRWCRVRIPLMHLGVELACMGIAVGAILAAPDIRSIWLGCALGWTVLTLAWIDWDHMLLPDVLTLPLILAGLVATLIFDPASVTDHAGAAAVGYAAFRGIDLVYRRLRGHDGLGQGDAKLLAAGGAWLGLAALPVVVFTAAVCGLLLAAGLRIAGHAMHRTAMIPFGPPLCAAIWAVWLGFDPITQVVEWLA
ncbi:MAG TPA: A24 family peptidase [Acetobacteraceae bacterium]|nr:A24 family peptidase [Acetobacteraceae bacterium]